MLTVLSQATSDVNSGRAFSALTERFSSWQEVLDAPTDEVADAIRSGGIADVKARRIKEILAEIERREGKQRSARRSRADDVSLARLEEMSDEEVMSYLCSLPGVGVKTAACVLLFSLGRDAFPVDTHVQRVAARLGLIDERAPAPAAHRVLEPAVPPELRYEFHMQLIRHGRTVCVARRPRCSGCVLVDLCEAGPRLLAAGDAT